MKKVREILKNNSFSCVDIVKLQTPILQWIEKSNQGIQPMP